MRKTIAFVVAMVLTEIGTEIQAQSPPASSPATGAEKAAAGENDLWTAKNEPEPAVYCTLLCCDKLQTDLHVTNKQHAELAKLQERLKASILSGGVHAQQHGPSEGKARTLAKMTETALAYVGKKVKDVLTAEQDRKLTEFYASGKLRPIEVAAAEVHDRMHGTKGTSYGKILLVPHYDDAVGNRRASSDSSTMGAMRGTHTEGSYYRDSVPGPSSTAKEGKKQDLGSAESVDSLLANLKGGPVLDTANYNNFVRALIQLERMMPKSPNPAAARVLETVLLENSNVNIQVLAANALGNWGTPESIPALQKTAKSSNPSVMNAAKKAIKKLMDEPAAGKQPQKGVEKLMDATAPEKETKKSLAPGDRDALLADIKSDDSSKRGRAIMQLLGKKPTQPDPDVAKALELVLLKDDSSHNRLTAAWALQNWGIPESVPALQKALKDPSTVVQSRAKKAIAAISSQQ
ncbi:MAG: HEAT repeat domain-containing protein [Planctomycetota bacterium]